MMLASQERIDEWNKKAFPEVQCEDIGRDSDTNIVTLSVLVLATMLFLLVSILTSNAQSTTPAPATVAIQINNVVNNMALELEQSRQNIVALQQELTKAQAKIKELENNGKKE